MNKSCVFCLAFLFLIYWGCEKDFSPLEKNSNTLVRKEMVLFSSDRNGGNMNIWMMEKDGSNPRQLTFYPEGDYFPADISPDGKTLLFYRWDHQSLISRIFIMPTTGPQPGPDQFLISYLCRPGNFFPDGQRFVYDQHTVVSDTFSHDAVYIFDLRDSSSTLVTPLGNSLEYAAYYSQLSPDGNKIAYVQFYFDQFGRSGSFLSLIDLQTSQIDTITPGTTGRYVYKSIFKNQSEIIFISNLLKPNLQINLLSLYTGDMTALTDFLYPHSAYCPTVDMTEEIIYFRYNAGAEPDTTSEIAMIDINGDHFKILTNNKNREGSPVVGVLEFYE